MSTFNQDHSLDALISPRVEPPGGQLSTSLPRMQRTSSAELLSNHYDYGSLSNTHELQGLSNTSGLHGLSSTGDLQRLSSTGDLHVVLNTSYSHEVTTHSMEDFSADEVDL